MYLKKTLLKTLSRCPLFQLPNSQRSQAKSTCEACIRLVSLSQPHPTNHNKSSNMFVSSSMLDLQKKGNSVLFILIMK
ncbi:hypothetical protein T4D_12203 [Trichinella pseudospiralis]|uniref:Uncharacterized protein n=1 Tax=Trichinella pseudospiralis TaxID=6337 RepID=A0A0V1F5I8_TRIPS|nr:hypothetical protein T4D_12203 [Trichinella pseudospiralis]